MRAVYFQWQCLCDAGVRWGDGDRVYHVWILTVAFSSVW